MLRKWGGKALFGLGKELIVVKRLQSIPEFLFFYRGMLRSGIHCGDSLKALEESNSLELVSLAELLELARIENQSEGDKLLRRNLGLLLHPCELHDL